MKVKTLNQIAQPRIHRTNQVCSSTNCPFGVFFLLLFLMTGRCKRKSFRVLQCDFSSHLLSPFYLHHGYVYNSPSTRNIYLSHECLITSRWNNDFDNKCHICAKNANAPKMRMRQTYADDNCRIIGQARLSFHLSILESVYIKTQNPVICKQKEFIFFLGLFN